MSDIQRDREERQHVIEVLQNMVDWMQEIDDIATPERIHALFYAIASIKTDLKYDLLYEETVDKQADKSTTKNDLVVDAVSRKAVINTLDNMDSALDDEDRTVETYKELLKECYKVLPSVTPQEPRWIPCSEKLPEYGEEVLTCSNGGFIEIQSLENRCDGYWENQKGDWSDLDEIIAWMPLQKPYKAESEEE